MYIFACYFFNTRGSMQHDYTLDEKAKEKRERRFRAMGCFVFELDIGDVRRVGQNGEVCDGYWVYMRCDLRKAIVEMFSALAGTGDEDWCYT